MQSNDRIIELLVAYLHEHGVEKTAELISEAIDESTGHTDQATSIDIHCSIANFLRNTVNM